MKKDNIVIVGASRTPMGGFQGELSPATATHLGATAIAGAVQQTGLDPSRIDDVNMGCVLPAGLGQAPARQAALGAGLAISTPCTTVNKMCGSGMKAAMLGHDALLAGSASYSVCGGMESMSNAPYLLDKARRGLRLGHGRVIDHMFLDGLEDAYEKGRLMGTYAEDTAEHFGFGREQQDEFAIESLNRARTAAQNGSFSREISPVKVSLRHRQLIMESDEQPRTASAEKIPTLKPAFREGGTVTPANSSSISDGAAALVITRASQAQADALNPRARIAGHHSFAQQSAWFTTAPVFVINGLMEKLGWLPESVDLYEINEAFAVVTMAAMRQLKLPHDKVNIHGGACALGHPIGASGARILVTLLHALEQHDLKRGVAALCIGGGEATAVGIELIK